MRIGLVLLAIGVCAATPAAEPKPDPQYSVDSSYLYVPSSKESWQQRDVNRNWNGRLNGNEGGRDWDGRLDGNIEGRKWNGRLDGKEEGRDWNGKSNTEDEIKDLYNVRDGSYFNGRDGWGKGVVWDDKDDEEDKEWFGKYREIDLIPDYYYKIPIGRHGLGFEKRYIWGDGLRSPLTPEALEHIGYRELKKEIVHVPPY